MNNILRITESPSRTEILTLSRALWSAFSKLGDPIVAYCCGSSTGPDISNPSTDILVRMTLFIVFQLEGLLPQTFISNLDFSVFRFDPWDSSVECLSEAFLLIRDLLAAISHKRLVCILNELQRIIRNATERVLISHGNFIIIFEKSEKREPLGNISSSTTTMLILTLQKTGQLPIRHRHQVLKVDITNGYGRTARTMRQSLEQIDLT